MTARRTPATRTVRANGVKLVYHEWPGGDPAVFFVHATGFHGRCWDAVVEALPAQRCVAVDVRGHGQSETPPPPYAWSTLGEDVAALAQVIELRRAVGVGHSMGGHLLVQAAARVPEAFAGLLLVEPVILPRPIYQKSHPKEEHFAARRRNHWSSPQEMIERFAGRPPFVSWQPQVLRDYCIHGLRPAPDGDGYVLACPPAVEAALYAGGLHPDADIYNLFTQIDVPVWVMRAGPPQQSGTSDMRASPTAPDLARYFAQGKDEHLADYTHFLPMENPALVAKRVETLVSQLIEKSKQSRAIEEE